MRLTLDDRQQICAAYLADEKVRDIAKRFGVTGPCVAYHVRHLPRRKSLGTCSKIYQLKRMAERQNRLMAIKQGDAANAAWALVVKQIAAKNTDLRSARDDARANPRSPCFLLSPRRLKTESQCRKTLSVSDGNRHRKPENP